MEFHGCKRVMCSSAGYANEVGEAFRALVPVSAVWASYAVATVYVSADALDKGRKAAAVSLGQSGSVWIGLSQFGSVWLGLDQSASVWITLDSLRQCGSF